MSIEPNAQNNLPSARFALAGLARRLPTMIRIAQLTKARHPDLQPLRDALISPFLDGDWQALTDDVTVTVVATGSREATMSATMLDWGCCSHYYTGQGAPRLPAEEPLPGARTYTLAAHITVGESNVVIGTLAAVVGNTVPALSLFDAAPGAELPHWGAPGNGLVGELRRFSVNPLFDVVPIRDDPLNVMLRYYRRRIYRELYIYSLGLFRSMRVRFVYGVATPEIYRFFTKSGQHMRRIDDAVLVDSVEVQALRRRFAHYWRPDSPMQRQPALYRILVPAAVSTTDKSTRPSADALSCVPTSLLLHRSNCCATTATCD